MQYEQPWWSIVRGGVPGAMQAHPLIRAKAIRADEGRLARSFLGYLSSLAAVRRQNNLIGQDKTLSVSEHMRLLADVVHTIDLDDAEFTERVKRKQAKLMRQREKFEKASRIRPAMSVSSDDSESGPPSC